MTGNSNISIGMYYYHGDHLGRATWITDANGQPVQYILYDPWGGQFANRSAYGSSCVTERYTFTGQRFGLARAEKNELASFAMPSVRNENKRSAVKEFDEETKYYNFEARQYDHWLRIFTAPDPLSDQTPDISPYAYCNWNPIKYVDPDGRSTHTDEDGRVVAVYDDNDLNIYKHSNAQLESWGDIEKNHLTPEEPNQWQILWAQNGNTLNFTLSYAVTQIDYPITQTEICTIQGAPLLCQQSSEKSINVGGLTRGIYILKVTLDTGEIVTTQFLKR